MHAVSAIRERPLAAASRSMSIEMRITHFVGCASARAERIKSKVVLPDRPHEFMCCGQVHNSRHSHASVGSGCRDGTLTQ